MWITSVKGKRSRKRAWRLGLAVLGAGFGALSCYWVGVGALVSMLVALRWAFPVLLLLGGVKHVLRVRGWQLALRAEGIRIPFLFLLRARLGAQSVAYLAGMGGVLSEPLKPFLLRDKAAAETTIAPTLVESFAYWVTALVLVSAGVVAAVPFLGDASSALPIATIIIALAGVVVLALSRQRGMADGLDRLVRRKGRDLGRWHGRLQRVARVENQIRSFRTRHPRVLLRLLTLGFGVQLAMLAEVWVVLSAVGLAPGVGLLLAIEGASRLVKMATFYVPGRLGTDEAGGAGSFLLLGLSPAAGLTLALSRRAQALLWVSLGFALLSRTNSDDASPSREPSRIETGLVPEVQECRP